MNLLLDTHVLLWFLNADNRLSADAVAAIRNPLNRVVVSVANCWEIAIKAAVNKLQLPEPAATFLPRELKDNQLELLPIEMAHVTSVETLPLHHRDPFDRILVAQAIHERLKLVSADVAFDQYGVSRLW